ncbi:hypothetical protein ACGF1Z_11670 [Streptomyces sp. NPDC048018]|uniref:hypothetical protein n=1 Tax=Streptomyces sp. NPDC048018 TaxID=3365499 RepID=UPI003710A3ED
MHPRRTAPALLVGLLLAVTGCVAVPGVPPTGPARPPAGLAPADDRPPAPLPRDWPAPTQDTPREALDTTDPDPVPGGPGAPAERGGTPHGAPAAERAARPGSAGRNESAGRNSAKRNGATRRQVRPKAPQQAKGSHRTSTAKKPHRVTRTRPGAEPADMRRLCREAERIRVPYGVPALCRSQYGR